MDKPDLSSTTHGYDLLDSARQYVDGLEAIDGRLEDRELVSARTLYDSSRRLILRRDGPNHAYGGHLSGLLERIERLERRT